MSGRSRVKAQGEPSEGLINSSHDVVCAQVKRPAIAELAWVSREFGEWDSSRLQGVRVCLRKDVTLYVHVCVHTHTL